MQLDTEIRLNKFAQGVDSVKKHENGARNRHESGAILRSD